MRSCPVAVTVAVAAALASGCLAADARVCASGRVCPSGTRCDEARDTCVAPGQVEACEAPLTDGDDCTFAASAGTCQGGLCVPLACGDGVVRGDEDCDGPATTASCRSLGFYDEGSPDCTTSCRFDLSSCTGFCRDGVRNGPEECDGAPPGGDCVGYGFDHGALPCGSLCAPSFAGCGRIGLFGHSVSSLSSLFDVWGRSATDAYTIGADTVQHFDGTSWSEVETSLQPLYGVSGNATDTFVVGRLGRVLHATAADPGTWEYQSTGTFYTLVAVAVAPDRTAVAVGASGIIVRYDGDQWSVDTTSPTTLTLTGVWTDGTSSVAVGDGVYLEDHGSGWAPVAFPDTTGLRTITGSTWGELAALAGTTVYRQDGGGGWTALDVPGPAPVDVALADDGAVLVVGDGGRVLRYDGVRWIQLRPPRTGVLNPAVWWGDGLGVIIGHEETNASPVTWTVGATLDVLETEPSAVARLSVWGSSQDDVWAVGLDDQAWRRDAVGWTELQGPPGAGQITTVWGRGVGDVLVGTDTGAVAHWNGAGWTSTAVAGGPITALWGIGGTVFASGGSRIYVDAGQGWQQQMPAFQVNGFSGSAPDDVWGAYGFGMFHYDGLGWSAAEIPGMVRFNAVWAASSERAFAVCPAGKLYAWDGQQWSEVASPTSRDLYAVWGFGADDVFAAGDDVLLHFDGVRWSRVRMGRTLHARALWGSGTSLWVAGVEGLYRMERTRPWTCASRETVCDDGVDDDCDGLADLQDDECAGG